MKMMLFFISLTKIMTMFYYLFFSSLATSVGTRLSMEVELLEYLMQNYSSSIHPMNQDTALNVAFNLKLLQVLSIDEKFQTITIQSYYQMNWVNEQLSWQPEEHGDITHIWIRPHKVWTPDVTLLNSADNNPNFIQKDTDNLKLYHNGTCGWFPKVTLTASFIADTKYFPFDSQCFTFKFESWIWNENQLRFVKTNGKMVDSHYVNSTEWELVEEFPTISRNPYDDGYYSEIKFTFTFHRKPSYFVMTMILPCIILISIVAFSYILPPGSGERMGVIITVLLAFAVFLEIVSSSLPQNSNSTSLTSLYILASMSECALSFLVTCIVIRLLHKGEKNNLSPPPQWLRRHIKRNIHKQNHVYTQPQALYEVEMQEECVPLKYNDNIQRRRGWLIEDPTTGSPCSESGWKKPSTIFTSFQLKELCSINTQLKTITKKMKEKEDECEMMMEWKQVANMVDKLSFWGFMLTTLLMHCLLFLGYERYY